MYDRSVPYDPYLPFVFQGEEILQSIRAFTFGYDIYAPVRSVAFHIYGMKENLESRRNVPHFDENEILYPGAKRRAYQRLIGVAGTTSPALDYDHFEEDKYGIGMVRSQRQFFETFGIHPEKREIERDLCDFVQGSFGAETSMHAIFSPFLRYDHMGIDYSRITHRHMTRDRSDTPVDDKELNFLKDQLRKNRDGLSEQGRVAFPK
jgi:Glycosyltransferase (GlcNAc)